MAIAEMAHWMKSFIQGLYQILDKEGVGKRERLVG